MTILVTGATGNLGRLIIAGLLERGTDPQSIVAGARNTEKAADLGVRVVHLDYSDPASVATAVEGIDTVVLVSGSEVGQRVAQHRAHARAVAASHVVQQRLRQVREALHAFHPSGRRHHLLNPCKR